LSLLHKAKRKTELARERISKAMQIFEGCEAELFLKQTREAPGTHNRQDRENVLGWIQIGEGNDF